MTNPPVFLHIIFPSETFGRIGFLIVLDPPALKTGGSFLIFLLLAEERAGYPFVQKHGQNGDHAAF